MKNPKDMSMKEIGEEYFEITKKVTSKIIEGHIKRTPHKKKKILENQKKIHELVFNNLDKLMNERESGDESILHSMSKELATILRYTN